MVNGFCSVCGEPTVYHGKLSGDEGKMSLVVPQNDRVFSMKVELFPVRTFVCGSCGYLELRADVAGKTTGASLLDTLAASESKDWQQVEPAPES
ncbi:MAG TPA: hypothetical protein VGE07_06375 [Herpetosiphonaceae bacterium]